MSDIFDHAVEAFESQCWGDDGGPTCGETDSSYDPLFYHRKIEITGISQITSKAYLIKAKPGEFWVPKKLCRNMTSESVYILRSFKVKLIRSDFDGLGDPK